MDAQDKSDAESKAGGMWAISRTVYEARYGFLCSFGLPIAVFSCCAELILIAPISNVTFQVWVSTLV